MPTRNVVLTEHQEELIAELVRSGRYQNASEVMREGLRLVELRDREAEARLSALRDAAHLGLAALDQGDYRDFATTEDLAEHLRSWSEEIIDEAAGARARGS